MDANVRAFRVLVRFLVRLLDKVPAQTHLKQKDNAGINYTVCSPRRHEVGPVVIAGLPNYSLSITEQRLDLSCIAIKY